MNSLKSIIICLIILVALDMLIEYICRIQNKMNYMVKDNTCHVNLMEEGLIILDRTDLSLKLATTPAAALFQ